MKCSRESFVAMKKKKKLINLLHDAKAQIHDLAEQM